MLHLQQNVGTAYQQMLVAEMGFSNMRAFSQLLIAEPADGVRIHFNYPRPAHFAAYEKRWPFPMEFDQEHNQIFLTQHWLSQPVRTGNPTTNVLAQNYLSKTSLSMAEIADLLNYTEAANFRRAFQRWNSKTPSEFRRQ